MTLKASHILVSAIVQARMGSTRLPGKVLKPVLGLPLLLILINRLKMAKTFSHIVVATTTNEEDNLIEALCKQESILCFRGDSEDVLSRTLGAMRFYGVDVGIRITGDCPLIDPVIVDKAVRLFLNSYPSFDYVSNCIKRTYPRGMDVEVFSYEALERVFENNPTKEEREHVTYGILTKPKLFRLGSLEEKEDLSFLRLTVDTSEDFLLVSNILEEFLPKNLHFSLQDIVALLVKHPEWIEINAHVRQKEV